MRQRFRNHPPSLTMATDRKLEFKRFSVTLGRNQRMLPVGKPKRNPGGEGDENSSTYTVYMFPLR